MSERTVILLEPGVLFNHPLGTIEKSEEVGSGTWSVAGGARRARGEGKWSDAGGKFNRCVTIHRMRIPWFCVNLTERFLDAILRQPQGEL